MCNEQHLWAESASPEPQLVMAITYPAESDLSKQEELTCPAREALSS